MAYRAPHDRISPPNPVAEILRLKRRVDWLEKKDPPLSSSSLPFVESTFSGTNLSQTSGELDFWNKCSINYYLGDVFQLPTSGPPGSRFTLLASGFYHVWLELQFNNSFLGYYRDLRLDVTLGDVWGKEGVGAGTEGGEPEARMSRFFVVHVDPSNVPAQLQPSCGAAGNTVNGGKMYAVYFGDTVAWQTIVNP